jgi:hypothetical protein
MIICHFYEGKREGTEVFGISINVRNIGGSVFTLELWTTILFGKVSGRLSKREGGSAYFLDPALREKGVDRESHSRREKYASGNTRPQARL